MTKTLFAIAFLAAAFAAGTLNVSAQVKPAGFSAAQFTELKTKKGTLAVPLPTWLPAGFKLDEMTIKVGRKVPLQDRNFVVTYSNTLPSGKVQSFSIEAGFDGIGDLMYDTTVSVRSGVGKVEIVYEPNDPDNDNKKIARYVMTQWFDVAGTAFHYSDVADEADDGSKTQTISLADTKKILASLKRF